MRHRVNEPDVVQEEIDGEVIIVHLPSGYYYSMGGSAADVWDGIVRGVPDEGIVESIVERWDGDAAVVGASVRGFLDQLRKERLVVADPEPPTASPEPADSGRASDGEDAGTTPHRGAFEAPALHKYTDMQELLLVDPIHEVEDTGWPERPGHPTQ